MPTEALIHRLNEKIIGWTNYYRGSAASKVFAKIDNEIFLSLERWCFKRHARKGKKWIIRKYFTRVGFDNWMFHCKTKDKEGKEKLLLLKRATDTHIRRHKKIQGNSNPFNPCYKEYFKQREIERKSRSQFANHERFAGLRIIQSYAGLSAVQ